MRQKGQQHRAGLLRVAGKQRPDFVPLGARANHTISLQVIRRPQPHAEGTGLIQPGGKKRLASPTKVTPVKGQQLLRRSVTQRMQMRVPESVGHGGFALVSHMSPGQLKPAAGIVVLAFAHTIEPDAATDLSSSSAMGRIVRPDIRSSPSVVPRDFRPCDDVNYKEFKSGSIQCPTAVP